MHLTYHNLTIRNAVPADAPQLALWWNDGKLMAHAGFPDGTGQKAEDIAQSISRDADDVHRRLIIEIDGCPAGEMNYRNLGGGTAEVGIKICDASRQNHGDGKRLLSMLFSELFHKMGYTKIVLDTNLKNKRAQRVYEQLGFQKVRVRENDWKDQRGELQTSIDYELTPAQFCSYAT